MTEPGSFLHSVELIERVVIDDAYLDLLLRSQRRRHPGAPWLGRVQRQASGTVEHWIRLEAVLDQRLRKPLAGLAAPLRVILAAATWRLIFEDNTPEHAIVNDAVNACRARGAGWATGLCNGVLRNLARGRARLPDEWNAHNDPCLRNSLPRSWQSFLGGFASDEAVLDGLRINPGVHAIRATDIDSPVPGADEVTGTGSRCWQVRDPDRFWSSSHYAEGHSWIQDHGIFRWLAAVQTTAGDRILDAFCAPGGKLLELASREGVDVVGLDRNLDRLELVRSEAARRRVICPELRHGDVLGNDTFGDGETFDLVIADAPCSASGTLPRHPDVALRITTERVQELAANQLELLDRLAEVVRPGGVLWYATCSVFPDENESVIDRFLVNHTDFKRVPVSHPLDDSEVDVIRVWPHLHGAAGFTAQKLVKSE